MLRSRILIAAAAGLLVIGGSVQASVMFFANLTTAQENPPTVPTLRTGAPGCTPPAPANCTPRPLSFGTANFILNDAMTALSFTATIFNIDFTGAQTTDTNDNLTAAHIHAGNPLGVPGTNAGVVWGFFNSPFNDLNSPTPTGPLWDCNPFATGVGGTCAGTWDLTEGNGTTLAAQLPNILAGRSYINFHTTQFGGGEIRGQLQVPEPSSFALLGIAAVGLVVAVRRRRSSTR